MTCSRMPSVAKPHARLRRLASWLAALAITLGSAVAGAAPIEGQGTAEIKEKTGLSGSARICVIP